MEQRANIKFCSKLGKRFTETFQLMHQVYGDDCLSRTQVFTWHKRFKNGRTDVGNDYKTNRSKTASTDELIDKIRKIITANSNVTCEMLSEEFGVSKDTIHNILTKHFSNKREICTRFVPHRLTEDQEKARVEYCKDIIKTAKRNPNFLDSIVTGNEILCFKYHPEIRHQSASQKSEKLCFQNSPMTIRFISFYDSKGIIHCEFVLEGKTVTGDYYLGVMERLWRKIVKIRPAHQKPGSLYLLHNDAPHHNTVAICEFFAAKQLCVIPHPPYSPDLLPCDYFLLPKLKIAIKEALHDDIESIQAAVTKVIEMIPHSDFSKSIHALVQRAKLCIDAQGTYFQ